VKKLLAWILTFAGGAISLWAGYLILSPESGTIYGYDPVYAGLFGLAVLTGGLIILSQD
jgi:hypothetical protein